MRLKFKNIGIVSKGDIQIDSISVVAGNNNSGKSTIGKLLYGISTSLNMLQDNTLLINKYSSISNELNGMQRWIGSEKFEGIYREYRDYLIRLEIVSKEGIDYEIKEIADIKENLNKRILEMIEIAEATESENNNDKLKMSLNNLSERRESSVDSDELKYELIEDVMKSEFSGDIVSRYSETQDAEIELLEDNGDTIKLSYKDGLLNSKESDLDFNRNYSKAFYLDDPFLFDNDLYLGPSRFIFNRGTFKYKHKNNLLREIKDSKREKNYVDEHIQHRKIQKIFSNVIRGQIVTRGGMLGYENKWLLKPISFDSISAGMKSFSILHMLVENGMLNNCEYLIFDEPETHLHPEWQLRLAELIVLISINYPVRILITSHSPYFIEAIDIYSIKHKVNEKVRFYYSKTTNSTNNMVEIIDVTEELDTIYKDMYKPLSTLEELRDEYDAD